MSYPGPGPMYGRCIMCDRPMRVWRYHLLQRNRGKFCSRRCYYAARQFFSDALADGRLEGILAPERKRAKAERLSTFSDSAGYSEMEARYAHQYLPPR